MVRPNEIRAGEVVVEGASPSDASLVFIGEIRTPWMDRLKCPRQGRHDGPICRIEVFAPWAEGLDGLDRTPLLDLKPDRGAFTPLAPPQAGDFETGDASSR